MQKKASVMDATSSDVNRADGASFEFSPAHPAFLTALPSRPGLWPCQEVDGTDGKVEDSGDAERCPIYKKIEVSVLIWIFPPP
jgi:hypothetical protein